MKVRTRFAPSPTGYLHVGGVRTALFAWLVAKQAGGEFILRIEDTDRTRHVEGSEKHIIESLEWLGISANEGPFRQSERLDIYKSWAQKLIDAGRAYADTYSEGELEGLRQQAKAQKRPFLFREHRPTDPPAWDGSQPLRLKSEPKAYRWHDEVMGDLSSVEEAVDDYIILKSDGYPTYNFAHIVDDYEMQISHVIRSQEFLPSMPKFLNLYEALNIEWPIFATLPYVLSPGGKKKLSKRDGAKDILDYKREGYLPGALVSFLATLGWNDGTKQEVFSTDELIKKFDLKRVQRSGAKFDEQRLLWVNGHFIRETPLDELYKLSKGFWPKTADNQSSEYKKAVLALVQERLKFLGELSQLTNFFFEEPKVKDVKQLFTNPSDKQLKRLTQEDLAKLLKRSYDELSASNFSEKDVGERLNKLLQELGTKPGVLFAAIRIAISGTPSSPQLFGTLSVIGKQKSLARIEQGITALEN